MTKTDVRRRLFMAGAAASPLLLLGRKSEAQIISGGSAGNGSMTFQVGRFYTANGITTIATNAAALTGSLIAGTPIYVPNAITLLTLSCETAGTVSGTAHARMALYTDAGGYPGVPVAGADSGDLTQTSAGIMTSANLNVSLASGWYWPVFETSGTAGGTLYAASAARPSINSQMGSSTASGVFANNFRTLLMTHTYDAALTTWVTSGEGTSAEMPVVALGF